MASNDGSLGLEDVVPETTIRRIALLAMDEETKPTLFCEDGHPVQWEVTTSEGITTAASILSIIKEDGTWVPVCVVDGKEPVNGAA